MPDKSAYTSFYLLRHGETEHNVARILQGHQDSPLTDKGKQEAKERAKQLQPVKFDCFFASDLMRAHKTAQILAAEKQVAINTTKLLRETTFGKYEGLKVKEFRSKLRDSITQAEKLRGQARLDYRLADEIETLEETAQRALRFMRQTALAYPGKTILAVSHSNVLRSILMKLSWPRELAWAQIKIHNLAYIILQTDGIDFFVKDTDGVEVLE